MLSWRIKAVPTVSVLILGCTYIVQKYWLSSPYHCGGFCAYYILDEFMQVDLNLWRQSIKMRASYFWVKMYYLLLCRHKHRPFIWWEEIQSSSDSRKKEIPGGLIASMKGDTMASTWQVILEALRREYQESSGQDIHRKRQLRGLGACSCRLESPMEENLDSW